MIIRKIKRVKGDIIAYCKYSKYIKDVSGRWFKLTKYEKRAIGAIMESQLNTALEVFIKEN